MIHLDRKKAREELLESFAATLGAISDGTANANEGMKIVEAMRGILAVAIAATATTDDIEKEIHAVHDAAFHRAMAMDAAVKVINEVRRK